MSEDGDSFSKSVEEEEADPKKISLFNYQNGKTLQDTLHAKADRVWDHSYVVYFDQETGASHTVCWSKSFFSIEASFSVTLQPVIGWTVTEVIGPQS